MDNPQPPSDLKPPRWGYWPLLVFAVGTGLVVAVQDYTGVWTDRQQMQTPMASDMIYRHALDAKFPQVRVGDDAWMLYNTLRQTAGAVCDGASHHKGTHLHTWRWRIPRKDKPDDVLTYTVRYENLAENGMGHAYQGTARHVIVDIHTQLP